MQIVLFEIPPRFSDCFNNRYDRVKLNDDSIKDVDVIDGKLINNYLYFYCGYEISYTLFKALLEKDQYI